MLSNRGIAWLNFPSVSSHAHFIRKIEKVIVAFFPSKWTQLFMFGLQNFFLQSRMSVPSSKRSSTYICVVSKESCSSPLVFTTYGWMVISIGKERWGCFSLCSNDFLYGWFDLARWWKSTTYLLPSRSKKDTLLSVDNSILPSFLFPRAIIFLRCKK